MSHDIRELHTCARCVWIALAMFGHPEQIMCHGFFLPPAYRDLSNWLRHLVRRILLVIALGIPSVPYQPGGAGRTSGARTRVLYRRTRPPVAPMPGPWSDLPRTVQRRAWPRMSSVMFRSTGVACRLEALRLAIMHPEIHADRLSRTIMRSIANKTLFPPRARLRRWRVPAWRRSLASMAVESEILRTESLLPGIFVDPC